MNRVIIVGAGVTGLSTAYHLAKRRFGKIILLDKGPVGDGSSQRAAGIITGLLWNETGVLVRKRCFTLYKELSEELQGYSFHNVGCLNLFSRESWSEREALLPLYGRLEAPYEILLPPEIEARWPGMRIPSESVGLYDPLGGYSEPSEYIPAMKQRLLELGVEIREGEQVTGFDMRNGAVAGVQTGRGMIAADVVVSTVYSWTRALLETMGVAIAVKCFVHQRYVTAPLASAIRLPAVNANPFAAYFRPGIGGTLLAGIETPEREEYAVESINFRLSQIPSPIGLKDELRQRLLPVLPFLESTDFVSESVGLLTFSMDGEPILGPLTGVPGLILGLAFHSGGFAYNPGTGELLAEYASQGKTSIDVSSWSPNRFDPRQTSTYLREVLRQKDIAKRRH
jgi:glycine/D-amino acid oxidase-like deaminating enzyme